MKKVRSIESLETSTLLKTIRPVKNMVYLTDRLPKPNYCPVRYRSFFELGHKFEKPTSMGKSSMHEMPKHNSLYKSSQMSPRELSGSGSLTKKKAGSSFDNPEWLPRIRGQGGICRL